MGQFRKTRPKARGINSPLSPQCKWLNFLGYYWRILFLLSLPFFTLFMLPVWASKKLRSQQRRPPFQLERQPTMAPTKKKATAGTSSTSTEPGRTLDGPQPQHEGANPQIEDITNEAALHGDPIDNTENTEAHQLTEAALS